LGQLVAGVLARSRVMSLAMLRRFASLRPSSLSARLGGAVVVSASASVVTSSSSSSSVGSGAGLVAALGLVARFAAGLVVRVAISSSWTFVGVDLEILSRYNGVGNK